MSSNMSCIVTVFKENARMIGMNGYAIILALQDLVNSRIDVAAFQQKMNSIFNTNLPIDLVNDIVLCRGEISRKFDDNHRYYYLGVRAPITLEVAKLMKAHVSVRVKEEPSDREYGNDNAGAKTRHVDFKKECWKCQCGAEFQSYTPLVVHASSSGVKCANKIQLPTVTELPDGCMDKMKDEQVSAEDLMKFWNEDLQQEVGGTSQAAAAANSPAVAKSPMHPQQQHENARASSPRSGSHPPSPAARPPSQQAHIPSQSDHQSIQHSPALQQLPFVPQQPPSSYPTHNSSSDTNSQHHPAVNYSGMLRNAYMGGGNGAASMNWPSSTQCGAAAGVTPQAFDYLLVEVAKQRRELGAYMGKLDSLMNMMNSMMVKINSFENVVIEQFNQIRTSNDDRPQAAQTSSYNDSPANIDNPVLVANTPFRTPSGNRPF